MGDPIEVAAIKNAFAQFTKKQKYCALGSIKSNLGHLEAASGISQLTKVILQLKHKTLVPSINANPINSKIRLETSPFYIQEQTEEWGRHKDPVTGEDLPRRSMINSFGAGGSYANLIVEEFMQEIPAKNIIIPSNEEHLVIFSAKTEWSLMKYLERIQDYLLKNSNIELPDVVQSLQLINHGLEFRAGILVSSIHELLGKINLLQKERRTLGDSGIYISFDQKMDTDISAYSIKQALEKKDMVLLAKYWTKGAAIDFKQLNANPNKFRGDLPKYAFDHNIDFNLNDFDNTYSKKNKDEYSITPHTYIYNEPYLKDHRVNGEQVLIGVTYVSLAIDAFFELFPRRELCSTAQA